MRRETVFRTQLSGLNIYIYRLDCNIYLDGIVKHLNVLSGKRGKWGGPHVTFKPLR